jgi:hypothetical protein
VTRQSDATARGGSENYLLDFPIIGAWYIDGIQCTKFPADPERIEKRADAAHRRPHGRPFLAAVMGRHAARKRRWLELA